MLIIMLNPPSALTGELVGASGWIKQNKEGTMNTHRTVQIHNLLDTCESKSRVCRRGAINLARIGNHPGAEYQANRSARFDKIAAMCRSRLDIRPTCSDGCVYRMKYAKLDLQRNALRIEIITPADRCGWNLKSGRIGGRPDDYHPCTFRKTND